MIAERLGILAQILGMGRDGAEESDIMKSLNLTRKDLGTYLKVIKKLGLGVVENNHYKTNDRGIEYLEEHRKWEEELKKY